jgi:hypothetical protein
MNAKPDTELFIRLLEVHNQSSEFEICVAHDNRCEDGTGEMLKSLQEEYCNIKVRTVSNKETIEYLRNMVHNLDKVGIFEPGLRNHMRYRIEQYAAGELVDPTKEFLWMSSGRLYNMAVEMSSGNNLVITPGDFIYLFKLNQLDMFMDSHSVDDILYGKPGAVWTKITNMDPDWLRQYVVDVCKGTIKSGEYRYSSDDVYRDYLRLPSSPSNMYLPDFRRGTILNLENNDLFFLRAADICKESFEDNLVQRSTEFHGFHFMTRKTFDIIGGFEEVYSGRAVADNKMTELGRNYEHGVKFPPQLSVAWERQFEIRDELTPEVHKKLAKIDPWYGKHPLPESKSSVYLHTDYYNTDNEFYNEGAKYLGPIMHTPPTRLA